MNDTPRSVLMKQFEIIYAKPLREKVEGLFEMTELSRKIIQNQLALKHPEMNEAEIKIEMFKIFYKSDFNETILFQITEQMKHYLSDEKKKKIISPK